jgi:Ribbon-helix-helix protein, copG family
MRRTMLDHRCRPVLVHVPASSLDYLDGLAREAQTSRSEVIRQRLAPPSASDPNIKDIGSQTKQSGA